MNCLPSKESVISGSFDLFGFGFIILKSTMSSCCYKCEKEIEDDDDYAECDGCDSIFHLKCASVSKKEANARKNSKCLKLFCPECFKAKGENTSEKLKEVLGLLYKIDLCVQQQKVLPLPASIEQKLTALDKKISNTTVYTNNDHNNKASTSYANVTKNNIKPTVVIRPKSKQQSAKTFEDISKNVNKNDVNVCSTKKISGGGVLLRCENPAETMKVKQVVAEKMGDNYEVVMPKIKCPRLRIANIGGEIAKESILEELKKHNPILNEIDIKLVTVIPRKKFSSSWNEAVIEVAADAYKIILDIGVLSLPWRECKIYEHLHINRCYKCCGFSHKSNDCKNSQKCSRCAGAHKHTECKCSNLCCINCKLANEKFNLNLVTNHHAWNKECTILKRRLASLANNIEFNDHQ